jgi:hypothetical protein
MLAPIKQKLKRSHKLVSLTANNRLKETLDHMPDTRRYCICNMTQVAENV